MIDLEHQIIPDVISLPGILAGCLASLATGRVHWLDSIIGAAAGAVIITVILLVGTWWAGQQAMGGGDIRLAAMLGAFLGWKVLIFSLFLASFLGGIIGVILLSTGLRGRKDPIPFGPFLAAGGAAGLFFGERMVRWYFGGFAGF
jgi:leader peptidase (prepilin peptidase)/N-methyltransferase